MLQPGLQLIVLFPAFTWNTSSEEKICYRTVGKLFGLRVEFQMCVKLLCDYTKAEYLTERTCYAEWRTRLLNTLT
jgi:hypothetical protein